MTGKNRIMIYGPKRFKNRTRRKASSYFT